MGDRCKKEDVNNSACINCANGFPAIGCPLDTERSNQLRELVHEKAEANRKKAYDEGYKSAFSKVMIGEYYCWQQCCGTEHCGECCRLDNGVIDYFENILFDDLK